MVHYALSPIVRTHWVRAVLLAALTLASGRASAIERPRVAVAVEGTAQLSLPREFGEGASGRALAQGAREACLEPGTLRPRTKHVECPTLGDVPDAQVCVDETVERALTLEITCEGAGATVDAVDLSRSGCETSDCFAVEAKRAGATDLLVVRAIWKDGLHLTGVVTNVATGRSRTVTAEDLEKTYNADWPRSGSQVLALLKWFSRRLALDILSARSQTNDGSPNAGRQPVLVSPAAFAQASPPSSSRRWIGWTLVAAGAAVGGAAGIVWWRDKDLAGCVAVAGDADPCREFHRTIVPAVILGAGAVAAIVAGSVVLIRGQNGEARVALSVQPSAVVLGGRF